MSVKVDVGVCQSAWTYHHCCRTVPTGGSGCAGDVGQSPTRVLVVQKGLGGNKRQLLEAGPFVVTVPEIPEPVDTEGIAVGMDILASAVRDFRPDVVLASSRGGKLAAKLLEATICTCPVVLVSAMGTRAAVAVPGAVVLLVHGTRDGTNPIERVRRDAASSTTARLVEYDDTHSLRSCEPDLCGLVLEAYAMGRGVFARTCTEPEPDTEPPLNNGGLCSKCGVVCEPSARYKCACGHYVHDHSVHARSVTSVTAHTSTDTSDEFARTAHVSSNPPSTHDSV
jgi:hypothetical protein